MAIRQSLLTTLNTSKARRKRQLRSKRIDHRGLRMEQLEDRRLLAGIQLAGISTNDNVLLNDGAVLNSAPNELKIRFSEEASLDPATLAGGIEIIRSGQDGAFEAASVTTDLNTTGAVVMKFTAVQPGSGGEGIVLEFTKSDRGAPGNVGITVTGDRIRIDINTNTVASSSASDVLNAVNNHLEANKLIVATIVQGNAFANVATPAINYSPLTLTGANQARATSNFGQGTALQVEFVAVPTGIAGNGLTLNFSNRDFGGPGGPTISVVDGQIRVELNTNSANPTTAQGLVSAINTNPSAQALLTARVATGSGSTRIGSGINFPNLVLRGSSDVVLTPGFIGLGETDNIAVFRFAETLPDDVYQINILGMSGPGRIPISDIVGNVFLDGLANASQSFELDLGARVLSVVPQPLRRQANGSLVHARAEVEVYFNDDDLDRNSAENVNFYQLILTGETARTTDDEVFRPASVSYDPHADRAVLTFSQDLALLAGGAGTFRLRIGTADALPLAPAILTPLVDAGASFVTALDINGGFDTGSVIVVNGNGASFVDGQTITIFNQQGVARTLEFEDTVSGPQGILTGNNPIFFSPGLSAAAMTQLINNAINNSNIGIVATLDGPNISLAGDSLVTLDPSIVGAAKGTQGTIISGSITNDGQPFTISLPGSSQEPGHRDIPIQDHLLAPSDTLVGVTEVSYNFQQDYGFDTQGRVLRNAITNTQTERVREIFEIFGEYFGIDFVETSFRGLTIAVGDVRAIDPFAVTGPAGVDGISAGGPDTGLAVLSAQLFDDQNDEFGGVFFQTAMREIGELLGLGSTTELPPFTVTGGDPAQSFTNPAEPIFPGDADIVHGQFVHRPEVKDIDLYQFEVTAPGLFAAETISERLQSPSHLDTVLNLYRQTASGERELFARNDDYFASDSFIELRLQPGVYFIGVSAGGNEAYNPEIEDSGFGGTSEGDYQLRLNFRGETDITIVDVDNLNDAATGAVSAVTPFDGDADGSPGGTYNFWFRAQAAADTLIVDKAASINAPNGSVAQPFRNVDDALAAAVSGDIVRIVGNGGADGDITTLDDNLAYEFGFSDLGGQVLADGASLDVPQGVTVMVDSGAIFKSRRAQIGVGSSTTSIDRSGGAFQVLGTPVVVDSTGAVLTDAQGQPIAGDVIFTSLHDTIGIDQNPDNSPPLPVPGDWGGIVFRSDLDNADESRFNFENEGIFLNHVSNATIRYGGGNVVIDGDPTLVDPIHIADARPTIAYNTITLSAHAAISANPDAFLETTFRENNFQFGGLFTPDYSRSGPDIDGNHVINNTINGVFVRIDTLAGNEPDRLNVPGRFDDTDIVHVLQENLIVNGQPGGLVLDTFAPPAQLVDPQPGPIGGILQPGTYNYRITFVDASGAETPASDPSASILIAGNPDSFNQLNIGQIVLDNLPTTVNFAGFVARRVYRSTPSGIGPYTLVTEINGTSTSFIDNGTSSGGELQVAPESLRARPEGRLRIDPGTVIKTENAIIELKVGADLIAEGTDGRPVVFTSLGDVRYGAGGDFDTNNQGASANAAPGDWGGIYAGYLSSLSLDYAIIAHAGGEARLEGGFRSFNPVEIHRADARIAHSTFEFNASGFDPVDGQANSLESRFGRGFNRPGTLFVRGAQPTIVDNIIRDNGFSPAISIDANSLNPTLVDDPGRSTGPIDQYKEEFGNQGPLISGNRLADNGINGMAVRGATLTTEGVWDDTDIVHVVTETIYVPDFHTYGGLRLESKSTESLVVKLEGADAGFTAYGNPLDIDDRIGGSIHIIGQPGFPVVLTALGDSSVGAGLQPNGSPQTQTVNVDITLLPTVGEVNNGLIIDNDVPVAVPGFFAALPGDAGDLQFNALATLQGLNGPQTNLWVLDNLNYIDPEGDGSAIQLVTTNLTSPATLVGDDLVVSTGNFQGQNGVINWTAETFFNDGVPVVFNRISFDSTEPLGDLQFVNFNHDVIEAFNEFLYLQGTPGEADFRAVTVGVTERYGLAHGGVYEAGPDLVNATYAGFAADAFFNLQGDVATTQVPFSVAGAIDTTTLVPFVDPQLGNVFGTNDVETAMAWNVDPTATSAVITSFLEVFPRDTINLAGDWRSVRFEEFSNDRNVDVYTELEPFNFDTPGTNTDPTQSEFVGRLAETTSGGDEELRLGFEVHGAVSSPGDVDVYSFKAHGGTEVWFDIDDTSRSLDTVIELVKADGTVLARSDNSARENDDPSLLFRGSDLPANHINPLKKSDFTIEDNYSVNAADAGMRVVLDGSEDDENLYFIRVRSSSGNLNVLRGGTSEGAYQLQIRLREQDEVPGSVVRYADIRFATNGIEVLGQPIHSPLVGETGDIDVPTTVVPSPDPNNNNVLAGQDVGNVFATDRAALSIAGSLQDFGTVSDVDAYTFQLNYELTGTRDPNVVVFVPLTIDIDYADGLERPDTILSVYDAAGNLLYVGNDSNIAEDLPAALKGNDFEDLTRGSVNTNDAYLGPIVVPEGTYTVAVTAVDTVPAELNQFFTANPLDPLVRLEPVNSLNRIAEARLDNTPLTGGDLQVPILFDAASIVPWTLADVTLYVSQSFPSGQAKTSLTAVNPFSGEVTSRVGSFNVDSADIAVRPNGEIRAFSQDFTQGVNDLTAGQYLLIDPATGAAIQTGHTSIDTYEVDPTDPPTERDAEDGIHFDALAFGALFDRTTELGFGVGRRTPFEPAFGVADTENILYQFTPDTGIAFSAPAVDRTDPRLPGTGTDIVERGVLDTFIDTNNVRDTRIITQAATTINDDGTVVWNVLDGDIFTVDDGLQQLSFELLSGPEFQITLDPTNGAFLRDGDTFFLDGDAYEFDTGEVLVVDAANGSQILDGDRFSLADNQIQPVIRTFEFNDGTGGPIANGITAIPFNIGMTRDEVVQTIVDAINTQTSFDAIGNPIYATSAVAMPTLDPLFSNRISLINSNSATENAAGVHIEGNSGRNTVRPIPNAPGTPLIPIEEIYTNTEFVAALNLSFNGQPGPPPIAGIPGVTVGAKGDRANFSGVTTGDFSEIENRFAGIDQLHDGLPNSQFTIPLNFGAADTREEMAIRIAAVINAVPQLTAVTAESDRVVQLVNAIFVRGSTDLVVGGGGPGGLVTGIAIQNNQLWAVSDNGGFYRVTNPTFPTFAQLSYVEQSVDLVGIRFAGLATPPRNVDGTAYRDDLLFGIDTGGRMHAFDLNGQLQPIFADGQSSIQINDASGLPLTSNGQGRVTGLSFSNLDYNLWHLTNARDTDPGHNGENSLYFGFESTGRNNVPADEPIFNPDRPYTEFGTLAQVDRSSTFDFPGGASGEIVSNEFDLSNYGAADLPTLYFNYFLETENAQALDVNTQFMRDSFRVFAAGTDGNWQLLATNNSAIGTPAPPPGELDLGEISELYDNGDRNALSSWRQAKVDLAAFAGQSGVRLRFEFSSAGGFDVGNNSGLGDRLYAVAGAELRDAQIVTVDGVEFELELGSTIVTPSGQAIAEGETITLHGRTFEFDRNGSVQSGNVAIPIADNQSPTAVAASIANVLGAADYTLTANLAAETVGNETIGTAVSTGLTGGADRFVAIGTIGDNPNLITQGLDVDMMRVNLNAGDTLQVTASPTLGSTLDPLVRIFDVAGNELAVNDNAIGTTAQASVSVNLRGTYYVAVSGAPNDNYDAVVEGLGTVSLTTGEYEVEVTVNGFSGVVPRQVGARVQLDGAVKISQSFNSALTLDGLPGVQRGRVPLVAHAHMTDAEVAVAIQSTLAAHFAGNYALAFPVHEELVHVVGHDVVAPGPFGLSDLLETDVFGAFNASANANYNVVGGQFPGDLGAADNRHEGVYIDDIIIGFAERGEMIVSSNVAPGAQGQFVTNTSVTAPFNPVTLGEYQLELRRAEEFTATSLFDPTRYVLIDSFDSNQRLSQEHALVAPTASDVVDGQVFTISDGVNSVTFEFEDVNIANGVQTGRQAIPFNPAADDGRGGLQAEDQATMARRIRDSINSPQVQAVLNVTAASSDGEVSGTTSSSGIINLFGNVVIGDPTIVRQIGLDLLTEPNDTDVFAVQSSLPTGENARVTGSGNIGDNPLLAGLNAPLDVDIIRFDLQAGSEATFRTRAAELGSTLDTHLRLFDSAGNVLATNDDLDLFNLDSQIVFLAPASGTFYLGVSSAGNDSYILGTSASGRVGLTTGSYDLEVDVISSGIGFIRSDSVGDENVVRDQGQLIISSSQIVNSAEFGIRVDAGARDATTAPHPGVARNLSQINSENLVPGAVIKNNIIAFNKLGGIEFSGQTSAPGEPQSVVPFGRIVNNTIYGLGGTAEAAQFQDTGILVTDNASPTLLNNIIANTTLGISVDASSSTTVIGGSLFQHNVNNSDVGLGARPILLNPVDPLFIDASTGNFYPAAGSQTIDSSMESLEDRQGLVSVRDPLGIPKSPIIAPELDALGQLRADDPDVEPGNGAGQNVFIDRGAVDRSDFAGPTAFLIGPRDNDSAGDDLDPRLSVVELTAQSLEVFVVQLVDGVEPVDPANGVGVNDLTVTSDQVKLFRDDVLLVEGIDYRFRYDSLNNAIRLIPLAGIWETNHSYRIELANSNQFLIVAPAGDAVADGDSFTVLDNIGNVADFEFDSGYVLTVPATFALQMPPAGGGLGGVTDQETFSINGTTFEFDNNGTVASGNVPIVFTPTNNTDDIAREVVDALIVADIGLVPKFLGSGLVHVGALASDVVILTNAPSLTARGTVGGGVGDGDTIRIDDGSTDRVFEIDVLGNGVFGTNLAITVLQSDTYEEIAAKIAAAIGAGTNLTPADLGGGVIHAGGTLRTVIDASLSRLVQIGTPGVSPAFGMLIPSVAGIPQNIVDTGTFQVGNGVGLPITFEFDSNNSAIPGNTVVRIPATNATLDQIANAMVQAIGSVGLGVNAVNIGNGRIELRNASASHIFNPLTSPLVALGTPGVEGSIAIPFVPSADFTSIDMAIRIDAALLSAGLDITTVRVGDQITIEGSTNVQGVVQSFVQGVRDLAGNLLKPNQPEDTTQFIINVGSGLDYGDAPASYATLTVDGGASHTVLPGYSLGAQVDVDVDGQPSATATGDDAIGVDDEDGVTFGTTIRGFDGTVTVTTSGVTAAQPGRLDAWVDFNQDGDFLDTGEKVFTNLAVANGVNNLTFAIPSGAAIGDTYARFRLSSTGGLAPTGTAIDGEVEDLVTTILSSPWQNGVQNADVTGDGRLQPIDVLHVVSFLATFGAQDLPVPPPFIGINGQQISPTNRMIDVDGNGRLQVLDAAIILSAIFLQNQSGEGEPSVDFGVPQIDVGTNIGGATNQATTATTRATPVYEVEFAVSPIQENDTELVFDSGLTDELIEDLADGQGSLVIEDAYDSIFEGWQ